MNPHDIPAPVSVRYDASDLRALNLILWHRWMKIGVWIALVLIALNVGTPMANGASLIGALNDFDWLSLAVVPVLLGLIIMISPTWSLRVRRKNGFDIPLLFTATPHALCIDHEQGRTDTLWSAIKKVEVKGCRLFVFTTPACAYIMSRRCFVDQAAFDNWAHYASSAIESQVGHGGVSR